MLVILEHFIRPRLRIGLSRNACASMDDLRWKLTASSIIAQPFLEINIESCICFALKSAPFASDFIKTRSGRIKSERGSRANDFFLSFNCGDIFVSTREE